MIKVIQLSYVFTNILSLVDEKTWMFISNTFKETSKQKQTPKGQNTLIFKLILDLLCQVSSILRSLWLLCHGIWWDLHFYLIILFTMSQTLLLPMSHHVAWTEVSLQPSEGTQFRQEIQELQNISTPEYLTIAFMRTVQHGSKIQLSAELIWNGIFWVSRICNHFQATHN